jgi:hypothetical protein
MSMMNDPKVESGRTWAWVAALVVVVVLADLNLTPWWGTAVGVIGGVLGAALGVYGATRKTESPRERVFLVRYAILLFALIAAFVACFFLLPLADGYRFLLFLPFGAGIFLLVRYANRER